MAQPLFELYRFDRELTQSEVVDALAGVPDRLRAIVGSLDAEALSRRIDVNAWSALEVMRHLRDVVQVYGMRFKWMILDDEPFLPNYDEDRWVAEHPDGANEVGAMLDEIAAYRAETVRLLRALAPDEWTRAGRHEVLGRVELEPYLRHELAHELQHIEQLRAALGP